MLGVGSDCIEQNIHASQHLRGTVPLTTKGADCRAASDADYGTMMEELVAGELKKGKGRELRCRRERARMRCTGKSTYISEAESDDQVK